jgi:coenzyme PQQ biosynthesis protein PqqD
MADLSAVYERSDSLVTRDLAGEKIIVPVRGKVGDLNNIFTLNAVANDIWALLDGKRTVADIIEKLEQEYEIDRPTLANDVCRVLDELSSEGLVRGKSS